ncbi:MAG: VOC family protein [Promethearchaeota archaeon]
MKIEHIAVSANSVEDSDKFFVELLDLKKVRDFIVTEDLMEQFFGVKKKQRIIRYGNGEVNFEAFITNDSSKIIDKFTHFCLIIEKREKLVEKANELNFKVIKVPRKSSEGYYLFLRDNFGNLYEIK